ncbi:transposase, partial [Empedobacter falsenii]|uniref:transposase n=1 Tax=Empedobacter falsenii TaxID=343874 RepID=UPI001C562E32
MTILAYQIIIFFIIQLSSFFGKKIRNIVIFLSIIFTIIEVFTTWLTLLQFVTIFVSYQVSKIWFNDKVHIKKEEDLVRFDDYDEKGRRFYREVDLNDSNIDDGLRDKAVKSKRIEELAREGLKNNPKLNKMMKDHMDNMINRNESVSQLRRIFFLLLLRVFVYLYLIIIQLFMNFKHYNQNQLVLFPYSFEDLIPENHPVRIVNDILEKVNIDPLLKAYSKEGNPSYHPVMMLKVMVFAYMNNIYSSRKIEKALRENINFMWLSNLSIVDHNTVNRFRTHKLEAAFKNIFSQVVLLLAEEGLVSLKQVFVDGTKIEAQAGRYTFVWANAIKTNKEKMLRQLEELWKYAQSVAKEEDKDPALPEFKEISKEKIRQTAENI